MKIGLIGEAPNDTKSISNLFKKQYPNCNFITLLHSITGDMLEEQRHKHLLRREYQWHKPDIVIFIRDLDGLENNKTQLNLRKEYFTNYNSIVDKKGMFLLHVYEIEALILTDINTFNTLYKTEITVDKDPMLISEPKEYLQSKCNKYKPSDNSYIFDNLDFEKLLDCRYFSNFIKNFNKIVN